MVVWEWWCGNGGVGMVMWEWCKSGRCRSDKVRKGEKAYGVNRL
jgi:hypothetical protein